VLPGDLIEVVADTGQSKSVVDAIVRGVLVRIEGAVGRGETVNLVGFGRFEAYQRGARHGRNVQTRESLRIPETRAVRFKIGKRRRHCRCRIKAQAAGKGRR